ncbi:MAG: iron ABC transporter permease [Deltaproteobacteria bacterium]|nr:iron ABC transporter permease [Deltaproteobacteria bacterium]
MASAVASSPTFVYRTAVRGKILLFFSCFALLVLLALLAIVVGSYGLSLGDVLRTLVGRGEGAMRAVIWEIRLPRIASAVIAGCGLALTGTVFQCLLKNPLASASTLGISHGAAFGAAFAIVVLGAGGLQSSALRTAAAGQWHLPGICSVTLFAFAGALAATLAILALARLRRMTAEAVILAGVALSALFTSGTILVQYFAADVEIAAVVFWTFGDVARATWREIGLMGIATALALAYFVFHQWDLNALTAGEDVARGLGVDVDRLRRRGMLWAAFVAALITCFQGVIAFIGLLAPHIARRIVGSDHRLLTPLSCLVGALLLLGSDTLGRIVIGSGALPVGVITSFMGAPLFIFLLLRGASR